ncbi:hypothetical protein BKA93DRAFT_727747 [Sparassis latifolia]
MRQWAHTMVKATLVQEVIALTQKQAGLRFNARHATHAQVENFDVRGMADSMLTRAPHLWDLLDVLLDANSVRTNTTQRRDATDVAEEPMVETSDDEYWVDDEPLEVTGMALGEATSGHERTGLVRSQIHIPIEQKKVSIMIQSTHQRCNALQSMIGIFLHSCNAPEAIVELLSCTGISISRSAIDDAITSLSRESALEIKKLGQTLRAAYAYDNFDVDIKHLVATAEKLQDSLLHLTSSTLLHLDHGVTSEDLQCSKELWMKSANNPVNFNLTQEVDWTKFITLHPDLEHPSGLTHLQRFNRWKFLRDLIYCGPEYFQIFAKDLEEPEAIDQIPVVKSKQIPAPGMDINQSTVQGNADALENLFSQGGVGDRAAKPGCTDVGDHVVLVHGDLSTCERVQSVQQSRGEEKTPWFCFQFVVFVIGLFQLKMACADAI